MTLKVCRSWGCVCVWRGTCWRLEVVVLFCVSACASDAALCVPGHSDSGSVCEAVVCPWGAVFTVCIVPVMVCVRVHVCVWPVCVLSVSPVFYVGQSDMVGDMLASSVGALCVSAVCPLHTPPHPFPTLLSIWDLCGPCVCVSLDPCCPACATYCVGKVVPTSRCPG